MRGGNEGKRNENKEMRHKEREEEKNKQILFYAHFLSKFKTVKNFSWHRRNRKKIVRLYIFCTTDD